MKVSHRFESVAASSRIRLARNFKDYPFPGMLIRDPHAEEQAQEIIRIIAAELMSMDEFELYRMSEISDDQAEFLKDRGLISRDLLRHRKIAAALVSEDESVSVMINEEDHVREQYFIKGFDLGRAYERISGIDDAISESIPFAFDANLGYLTACPTNLGTGLRASVKLFLPACSRRRKMDLIAKYLTHKGLTLRGAFGEGSAAEGDFYQVSNEVTLGPSEDVLLEEVEQAVLGVVEMEIRERERMKAEGGLSLRDKIARSYGVLTNCLRIDEREFTERIAEVKLGVALGYFASGEEDATEMMAYLDGLVYTLRPSNVKRQRGELTQEEAESYRAIKTAESLRRMDLHLA